jgi:pimeloyl-ACP methyl ester carboxylesterase
LTKVRRIGVLATLVVVAAACSGSDGGSTAPPAESISTGPVSGPGSAEVGGVKFAHECAGVGSPMVILEHGLVFGELAELDLWAMTREAVSRVTSVCSYGRRGVMGTDPLDDSTSRTVGDQIEDLRALIDITGWQGPFVLVGHSAGGANVMLFAEEYPELVAGLVLVDSVHPDAPSAIGGEVPIGPPEFLDADSSLALLRPLPDLGDLPVRVLSRGANVMTVKGSPERGIPPMAPVPPFLGTETQWAALQADLLNLSGNAELTVLSDSGHIVEADRPDAIADAVRDVIDRDS